MSPDLQLLIRHLLAAVVFSVLGAVVFFVGLFILARACPFSIRKEIEEDQNISLGIIIGAVIIGMSLIISSAIQG